MVASPRSTPAKPRSEPASALPFILREMRLVEGLTQRELADRLGVSQTCITRWETGSRRPSWDELIRVGHLLRITWVLS